MLVAKNLLIEMAVYSEEEIFDMNPVASVSSEATNNLEGEELRHYVYQTIQDASRELNCSISEDDIGVLIRHHCGFRPRKKAALLALPYIVSANLVTAPWRKQVDKKGKLRKGRDRRPSGMISAPIMIDGVKYLCNITNKTNLQGRIALYALTLKDGNGNIVESEKMADPSNVPHSNSEQSANGNAHLDNVTTSHEPNPSFQGAKVQQNIETNKNNDIKTENIRMNKKHIRLTEQDLHRIVKESINTIVEDTKAQRKKDPMNQWFKDMDDAQKHRDNMEYITKGGRKPKHWKQRTDEGLVIENEARFLPHLKRTYENLRREYGYWQYANYKPQGMDNAISAIIEAMHSVEDVIKGIEPSDNIPTWEDPQQY